MHRRRSWLSFFAPFFRYSSSIMAAGNSASHGASRAKGGTSRRRRLSRTCRGREASWELIPTWISKHRRGSLLSFFAPFFLFSSSIMAAGNSASHGAGRAKGEWGVAAAGGRRGRRRWGSRGVAGSLDVKVEEGCPPRDTPFAIGCHLSSQSWRLGIDRPRVDGKSKIKI
jgi:hypothetical protein